MNRQTSPFLRDQAARRWPRAVAQVLAIGLLISAVGAAEKPAGAEAPVAEKARVVDPPTPFNPLAALPATPALAASYAKLPALVIPATCGMQIKGYATTADYDQLHTMGVQLVRRGFHWEGIEKEKDVYDFTGHDETMKDLREHGLRVVGCLVFGNKLYPKVIEAEGREAYTRYAAALAARYKGDKVIWEVWNEPNTRTFWGSQGGGKSGNNEAYAEQYVQLVKASVAAMRAADPDCTIVAGSVSCLWSASYKWTDFCFAKGILATGIDGWSVHPYSPNTPEEYVEAYDVVRDMMVKHGAPRDFPLLNTERGWGTGATVEGATEGKEAMKTNYQAWLLVRQQLVDVACGLRLTSWYEWKNAKERFGIYNDDKPNLACTAYQTMIAQLRGYRFSKRLELASPQDYAFVFTGPGDSTKLVVWTAPPPKVKGGMDNTVAHAIDLPVATTGQVPVVSVYGVESTVAVADGKLPVTLDGGPQYITVKPGK